MSPTNVSLTLNGVGSVHNVMATLPADGTPDSLLFSLYSVSDGDVTLRMTGDDVAPSNQIGLDGTHNIDPLDFNAYRLIGPNSIVYLAADLPDAR